MDTDAAGFAEFYERARDDCLRAAMVVLAFIGLIGLVVSVFLPAAERSPEAGTQASGAERAA